VAVNGQPATADGLAIHSYADIGGLSFQLASALNTNGARAQFAVVGGETEFNIGPQLNAASTLNVGLGNLRSGQLGFTVAQPSGSAYTLSDLLTNGRADMNSGHLDIAQQVVKSAIRSVSITRGRIGALRAYDIQSAINSLNVKVENLSSAESQIRDTEFAAESSALARGQILAQASQFALSSAQENQKIILKLLGG
jgi:flagellin